MHVARFEVVALRHLTTNRRLTATNSHVHQDVLGVDSRSFMSAVGDLKCGSVDIGEGAPDRRDVDM